jgi:hypothetical protein
MEGKASSSRSPDRTALWPSDTPEDYVELNCLKERKKFALALRPACSERM